MRATKELLLAGGQPAPFSVPALAGAEVMLRALSPTEAAEVQGTQTKGIHVAQALPASQPGSGEVGRAKPRGLAPAGAQSVDLNMSDLVQGNRAAHALAAHYGLVEPAMTLEEVQAVRPAQVVEQIGLEVMARSGLGRNQAEQLAQFREIAGGPDDAGDPAGGDPPGPDAG